MNLRLDGSNIVLNIVAANTLIVMASLGDYLYACPANSLGSAKKFMHLNTNYNKSRFRAIIAVVMLLSPNLFLS